MEREELISVIVPVYNAEQYLERCVNSIINQTYRNLEIILVNDGSTDQSGELCDSFALQDKRIRVFHKENGGSGSAKNTGFAVATGEYLALVDSDDWIEPDMYQSLLSTLKEYNAQIIACGIRKVTDNGEIAYYNDCLNERIQYTTEEALLELPKNERITNSMCNKLFHKRTIQDLRMDESIAFDDDPFVPKCIARAEKIFYTAEPFYNYYQRQNSISSNVFSAKLFDWVTADRMRLDFYRECFPQCENAAAIAYIGTCLKVYYQAAVSKKCNTEKIQLERELKETLRNYHDLPFSKKQKAKTKLFSFSPKLYILSMKLRGK